MCDCCDPLFARDYVRLIGIQHALLCRFGCGGDLLLKEIVDSVRLTELRNRIEYMDSYKLP